jgi:hypothetical protein
VTVLCAAALDSDPLGCELLRAVIKPGSEVPRPSLTGPASASNKASLRRDAPRSLPGAERRIVAA